MCELQRFVFWYSVHRPYRAFVHVEATTYNVTWQPFSYPHRQSAWEDLGTPNDRTLEIFLLTRATLALCSAELLNYDAFQNNVKIYRTMHRAPGDLKFA